MNTRVGTLVLYEILGAFLFTRGAVVGDGFMAGLMVGVSLGLFALAIRERDTWPSWFQGFSLLFSGTTFLMGNWWLVAHGRNSSPPLITFGPLFLAMALYSLIKRLVRRTQST
jgi:hypothetical protein